MNGSGISPTNGMNSQTRRRMATFLFRSVPNASSPSGVPRCHDERSSDFAKSLRNQPIGAPLASNTSYVAPRSIRVRALNENTGCVRASSAKKVTCSLNAIRFCWATARTGPSTPLASTARIS